MIHVASGRKQGGFVATGCSAAVLSPDGALLAAGESDSNDFYIWDIQQHKLLQRVDHHSDTVAALAFSPDSKRLTALDHSAVLTLWDTATGRNLWAATSSPGATNYEDCSVVFAPDGRTIVTANTLGLVSFWHASTGRELLSLTNTPMVGIDRLAPVSFCEQGKYIVGRQRNLLVAIDTAAPTASADTME